MAHLQNRLFLTLALCVLALLARPAFAQVGSFPDVPQNHWAAESLVKLQEMGIVQGTPVKPSANAGNASSSARAYHGDKPVTRYELAVALYRFVQYIQNADQQRKTKQGAMARPAPKNGAEAVRRLITEGYLPAKTTLAKQGTKVVTANELANILGTVVVHLREKMTPISPDSELAIPEPTQVPGT